MSARASDVAAGLDSVRRRIEAACAAVGRDPAEVTLVVVTKTFPADDVRILHDLGVRHVAENRHQEGSAKRAECARLDLVWHFVGHLQSNKAGLVGSWADVVHSVDRARLLPGLARAGAERERPLDVLVQVSLDPPGGRVGTLGERSGVDPEQAVALAAEVAGTPGLLLRGVMGVAPPGCDATQAFALLARIGAAVRERVASAGWMSAGMSGDLDEAVAAGATHVRVGSAVLGNRSGAPVASTRQCGPTGGRREP